MSSVPLLLLLVLSISLHACKACPLGNTRKDTANYHFHKELDKVTLLEICESCSSTSNLKEMIVGGTSGIELSTSLQTDSSSFLATKEHRTHSRSMLGPSMHHVEETVITNPSDTTEDIVDLDYAQPHRKPPIHNDKP
ncbi:PREDICTED: uncharacterized protein LOC109331487 [Lupinus angustifolius]|uniref:uncharacterized protein LOC109331487 n=1 Tax=Lupinus angustifolius TaxID=3871 RepID=UPI00092EBCD7|nr:PREDICTED: uncharacterized protein LOC109331487 [Lupinus angustifolius]